MTHVDLKSIADEASKIQPWIVERRRHLHQHPEISYQEEKTAAFVRAELEKLGLKTQTARDGYHGFFVDMISEKNPKEFVLLRADMDALPIHEESDVEYRSKIDGAGHQCGHDAHTSMLLGAASLLRHRIASAPVSARLVFQHAEEVSPGGAKDFVDAGLTKDVLGCFGMHVSPRVRSGNFGVLAGEVMAAVGSLSCTIIGRGGHAAAPHEAIDPMPAAASAILNLQQISSRRIAPVEPVVVSVTIIHAGTASNVIPESVRFEGTYRTFNKGAIPFIEKSIVDIVTASAAAYGCKAEIRVAHTYPPVINDEKATDASKAAIEALFGVDAIQTVPKSMGAEDFAYFAQEKPSSFVFLGTINDGDTFYPLHHPRFLPDESKLWRGAALLAAMPFVAPDYLR